MNECKCGNEALEDHTCPYAEEIGDDYDTLCNCCQDCIDQCVWDI